MPLERETISAEDIRKLLGLPPADNGEPVLSGSDAPKADDAPKTDAGDASKPDDEPPKPGDAPAAPNPS